MKKNKHYIVSLLLLLYPFLVYSKTPDWIKSVNSIDSGDTAWVMSCAILVLFMTVPGIALFYAGMVRKKNILSTMLQSFACSALVSILWIAIGYSVAFTPNNPFLGGLDRFFLSGLNVWTEIGNLTVHPLAPTIPESTFVIFQMAFAIISCSIIAGSFVERIKFSALLTFIGFWLILVYVPTAHWVWEENGWLSSHGVLDYAGGTVVHINAGIAGLVGSILLGKRMGYGKEILAPSNLSLTLIGTAMLWFGWFGFNAGSALTADGRAAIVLLTTQCAASAGAFTWLILEKLSKQKASALGFASGVISGLVGITPAAGFVQIPSAILIGIITTIACFFAVVKLKQWLKYDDSLDAFGIHGVGGIVGALLTGVFYSQTIADTTTTIWNQTIGVFITVVYSAIMSFFILFIIDKIIGLRVTPDTERTGLDIALHGEKVE